MQNGLWGHALFLASKMDERSYSNVMLRFANGLVSKCLLIKFQSVAELFRNPDIIYHEFNYFIRL